MIHVLFHSMQVSFLLAIVVTDVGRHKGTSKMKTILRMWVLYIYEDTHKNPFGTKNFECLLTILLLFPRFPSNACSIYLFFLYSSSLAL